MDMKVILDKSKFKNCVCNQLGLLISLKQSHSAPSSLTVVGHCACSQAPEVLPDLELSPLDIPTPDWVDTVLFARSHFPGGCDVGRGVWVCVDSRLKVDQIWKTLTSKTNMLEVLEPTVFMIIISAADFEVECFAVDSGTLSNQPVQIQDTSVKDYLNENTALCRLTTSVPLCIPQDQQVPSSLSSAEHFINDVSTLFHIPSKPSRVFSESTPEESTIRSALPCEIKSHDTQFSSSQYVAHINTNPVSIEVLTDHSQSAGTPLLSVSNPMPKKCLRMSLSVDVLVLVHLDSPLSELAAILREKVVSHFKAAPKSLTWILVLPPTEEERVEVKERKVEVPCSMTVHHVALRSQSCPVTVTYPYAFYSWEEPEKVTPISTDDLQTYREKLYKRFCLGNDLPHLRIPQYNKPDSPWLSSNATLCTGVQLLNPHLHLRQAVTGGGSLATVQGDYLYYHYMQDGFNDSGWGCAYRSLQTLWSWFLLQGYTTKTPPTHRAIQESVVAAKARSVSLIDSKQWIGSFEVNMSLNQLLQITCRIIDSIKGSDMASVGRKLLEHFKTQGTPVMIGGGVLAHTILGVSFNEVTGDTQFLVLDPHYTGKEDIKTITEKGKWCGWKQVSFWDSKANYNLCLPQRPDNVI